MDKQNKRQLIKEKLEEDVRLIKERYQMPPSFPLGSFQQLRTIEVWSSVLSFLTGPDNILSLWLTCQSFQEILLQRRMSPLLSKVLQILRSKFYLMACKADSIYLDRNEFRNVLELRAVSKSWKLAIEEIFFENSFKNRVWHCHSEIGCSAKFKQGWQDYGNPIKCNLTWDERVDSTLSVFSSDLADHSLIRRLEIYEENFRQNSVMMTKIFNFLEDKGSFVWTFKYSGYYEHIPKSYDTLLRLLNLMPNLKALILNPHCPCWNPEDIDKVGVKKRHKEFPFPAIETLEHFEPNNTFYLLSDVQDMYVLESVIIKCVNLKSIVFHTSFYTCIESVTNALADLKIEQCEAPLRTFLYPNPAPFTRSWPIKKLFLNRSPYYTEDDPFELDSSLLYRFVNQLNDTLTHLEMDNVVRIVGKDKLDLPNLKILRFNNFYMGEDSISFDELKPLQSLEELCVSCSYLEDLPESELAKYGEMQVKGFVMKMEKSNIWTLLSNLNLVDIFHFGYFGNCKFRYIKRGSIVSFVPLCFDLLEDISMY